MVLDPVSALGVAGCMVQFIQFSGQLISQANELHRSGQGAFLEIKELEAIAETLMELNASVEASFIKIDAKRFLTPQEQTLRDLCKNINRVASQLLEALNRIKVISSNGKWKTFREALNMIWNSDRIDEMARTLDRYRGELNTSLLVSLRNSIDNVEDIRHTIQSQRAFFISTQEKMSAELLGKFDENRRWQADLIDAIHEENWKFYRPEGQRPNYGDLDKFSTKLTGLVGAERLAHLRQKVLRRLEFPNLKDRWCRIPNAHRRTFQWIFSRSDFRDGNRSNFAYWLEHENGIYWITGKPASGKSTILKLIYDHPTTRALLETWAASEKTSLIIASYFFWKAGHRMQKSQVGLLQTLLFDILRQRPSLIPKVFPERWEALKLLGDYFHPWTWTELEFAFKVLIGDNCQSLKFFFLIDGLDECEDDHANLAKLLQEAASMPDVKICLGSRPEQSFKDAFGPGRNLRMQDLTLPDIVAFVDDKLCNDWRFDGLRKREPEYAKMLVRSVAEKSAGVFLWVALVVRSLLEGIQNSDRISDLQRRLEQIPPELDDLYSSILQSLDKFYLEHASQIFQVVRAAQEPLNLLDLSYADEEDATFALKSNYLPLSDEELLFRCDSMDRRLSSRCKGLLEASIHRGSQVDQPSQSIVTDTSDTDVSPEMKKEDEQSTTTSQSIPVRGDRFEWPQLSQFSESPPSFKNGRQSPPLVSTLPPRTITTPYWESERPSAHIDPDIWSGQDQEPVNSSCPDPSLYMGYYHWRQRHSSSGAGDGRLQDRMTQDMYSHCSGVMELSQSSHSMAQYPRRIPQIDYLHRTAKDFIERPENWDMLLSAVWKPFNPALALLRSSLLHLKSLSRKDLTITKFWSAVSWCMKCAYHAEKTSNEAQVALLDEIDRTAAQLAAGKNDEGSTLLQLHGTVSRSTQSHEKRAGKQTAKFNSELKSEHWVSTEPGRGELGGNFFCLAVQYDLVLYIQAKIEQGESVCHDDRGRPMLDYVFTRTFLSNKSTREMRSAETARNPELLSVKMVKLLFEAGADPNEWSSNATPWQRALEMLRELHKELDMPPPEKSVHLQAWFEIIRAFILAGADPKANHNSPSGSYVREIFEKWDSEGAQKLERLIRKRRIRFPRWGRGKS